MATILSFDIKTCQNTQMVPEMGSNKNNNRKSDILPVSRTIFFGVKFSIWPLVAILNFDVWARQNRRNDTRK